VKRITLAAILALGIHGCLMGLSFDGSKRISIEMPKLRVMNISLAPMQPAMTTSKTAVKKPQIKTKKKLRQFSEPKPKKVIKEVIQKTEKEPLKTIPQKTVEMPNTFDLSEQTQKESVSKDTDTQGEPASGNQIIREARPLYRSNPPPDYPALARRRGYQGNVVLEVLVAADGNVIELHVLSSSGYPILDRAAASSVKHWTFEPGMRGQEKVEMWVRVPIRFELR
jgi:periplasmic protein TonB